MYVTTGTTRMLWHSGEITRRVYVNFDHPFEKRQSLSDTMLTQHANMVYDLKTLEVIKNRDNVELTDDLLQQINDVLLIQEL